MSELNTIVLLNTRFTRVWLSLLLLLTLSACVTTHRGGFDKEVSTDEAIASRVAAAKQYLLSRNFEAARRHLKIAYEIDPKSADVHDALALTFQYSSEYELAEFHYKEALDFGGGESRLRFNYANFLFQQKRFIEAEEQLQAIVKDSLYEKRELGLVMLGLCQQQLLETAKAQRSFQRALILNPRNSRVLRELSIMKYEAKNFPDAWRYFQSYRKVVSRPDAELLLLGIELARELNDANAEASYALALKNLYPDSREYQGYLRRQQYE